VNGAWKDNNLLPFMKPGGSLLHSQETIIGLCPLPDGCSLHCPTRPIFSLLSLFWECKSRLMRSPCCLCVPRY
jgi:hypothetical protein